MNIDSYKIEIEKNHPYSKSNTSKVNCGFLNEQKYNDDASRAIDIKAIKESVEK